MLEDHADQPRPIAAYVSLIALFNALAAAGLVAGARADRLPERFAARDLALLSVATFKLSRILAAADVLQLGWARAREAAK